MTKNFIGIDVCEQHLDIFIYPTNKYKRFKNTKHGISELVTYLSAYDVELIAMEATGNLETSCAFTLMDNGYHVSIINPYRICCFRRSFGLKAKTDLIDAEVISLFANIMRPAPSIRTTPIENRLRNLTVRRKQLICLRDSERNRLRRVRDEYAREDINLTINFLNTRVKQVEQLILTIIKQDSEKLNIFNKLTSIPGVGSLIAVTIICMLPELGSLNQKQISCLSGVIPLNIESGKSKGHQSMSHCGRSQLRSSLYMAALVGIRHNKFIKAKFYDMVNKGKAKKVALGACMRKIIIIANSMIKENRKWRE